MLVRKPKAAVSPDLGLVTVDLNESFTITGDMHRKVVNIINPSGANQGIVIEDNLPVGTDIILFNNTSGSLNVSFANFNESIVIEEGQSTWTALDVRTPFRIIKHSATRWLSLNSSGHQPDA